MFDFLKRSQLVRRGLASGKTRRRRMPNELLRKSRIRFLHKVFDLCRLYRGTCFSDLQRPTAGADEEFRHRAFVFRDRDHAALDQSAEDLFVRSSRLLLVFGIIFVQLAVTKGLLLLCNSGTFAFLKPETGVPDCALRFGAARPERSARSQPRPVRGRLCQSVGQHSVWQNRCALACLRVDQRFHRRLPDPAGAPAQQTHSRRVWGWARDLASRRLPLA